MMIWLILFIFVVVISFILAFRSMSDYRELPSNLGLPYSLYLIRKPQSLNEELIKKIYDAVIPDKAVVSFEKLFKGGKQALVFYAPVKYATGFAGDLDLLELEDYSFKRQRLNEGEFFWELGFKNASTTEGLDKNLFGNIPELLPIEEFWWQLALLPVAGEDARFKGVLRAMLWSKDGARALELKEGFTKIGQNDNLAVLPQAHSDEQLLNFYRERSVPAGQSSQYSLGALDIKNLLSL